MTLGFNNTDKTMTLTTITNMGTGTLCLSGEYDETSRSATLYGKMTNPVTKNPITIKQVVHFIDKDTIRIENYDKEGDTEESKTIEYQLIRKV
jgi:hypothetical protein